jgi:hypothetical protein
MYRQQLANYRGFTLTQDTGDALHALEKRAGELGRWELEILGPPPGHREGNPLSLAPAGREVHFKLRRTDRTAQEAINAAWACAVPLGFTPNDRWPRVSDTDEIFYFLGPWQTINDRLLSEGRGHLAWPSVCCAAQVDVGAWKGDRETERFAQAQLHRIGQGVGAVDGVVGRRTLAGVEALGLKRPTLAATTEHLRTAQPPERVEQGTGRGRGHLTIPGHIVHVQAFGSVTAQKHGLAGAFLTADGAGRLVVEVERA